MDEYGKWYEEFDEIYNKLEKYNNDVVNKNMESRQSEFRESEQMNPQLAENISSILKMNVSNENAATNLSPETPFKLNIAAYQAASNADPMPNNNDLSVSEQGCCNITLNNPVLNRKSEIRHLGQEVAQESNKANINKHCDYQEMIEGDFPNRGQNNEILHPNYDQERSFCNMELYPNIPNKGKPIDNTRQQGLGSDNFNNILLIQTGQKRYKCEHCEKTFSNKSGKERHSRVHSGRKPFSCDICNRAFYRKIHLEAHIRIHTREKSFSCDICPKEFSQPRNLKRHKLAHTGEKPFKSNDCEKAFARKQTLSEHALVHTGEKLFKCELCDRSYARLSSLRHHQRSH